MGKTKFFVLATIVLVFMYMLASSNQPSEWMSLSGMAKAEPVDVQGIRWATAPGVSKKALADSIHKTVIITYPDVDIGNQFCEDVIAVELMSSNISVVSREKRERQQLLKLIEAEEQGAKEEDENLQNKKDTKKPEDQLADLLTIGRVIKADALVMANLLTETIQRNVYDPGSSRLVGLRDELAVRAASVTVVEVGSGRLLLAGYVGYENGVPLVKAAADIGRGLVQQMR